MGTTTDKRRAASASSWRHRESGSVRLMALGGVCLSVTFLALGVTLDSAYEPAPSLDLVVWTLASVAGGFATLSLGRPRPALSMDLPVLLACSFVLGPIAAGGVALVSSTTIDELRGRVSLSKVAWNHAQVSISVLSAGYAFVVLGGELGEWPLSVIAAACAISVDAAINYSSVAFFTSVSEGTPIRTVLGGMSIGDRRIFGLAYGAFALTGLLIAEAYVALGPVSLVVAIAPVLLGRQLFSSSHQLERASRRLRSSGAALMRVDDRIADERRDERARVAEALHDEVLQALYTVTLHAHVIREDYRSGRLLDLENDVPPLVESAERAAALTREVIYGLRRASVGHAGLVETIRLLVAHLYDESGIVFIADLDDGIKADPAVELLVYQVTREALSNIVRHSQAKTAWLSLKGEGDALHLTVADDGEGFDPGSERDAKHFGLDLMEERVEATGGRIEVRSSLRGGTNIEAWFRPHLRSR